MMRGAERKMMDDERGRERDDGCCECRESDPRILQGERER